MLAYLTHSKHFKIVFVELNPYSKFASVQLSLRVYSPSSIYVKREKKSQVFQIY